MSDSFARSMNRLNVAERALKYLFQASEHVGSLVPLLVQVVERGVECGEAGGRIFCGRELFHGIAEGVDVLHQLEVVLIDAIEKIFLDANEIEEPAVATHGAVDSGDQGVDASSDSVDFGQQIDLDIIVSSFAKLSKKS